MPGATAVRVGGGRRPSRLLRPEVALPVLAIGGLTLIWHLAQSAHRRKQLSRRRTSLKRLSVRTEASPPRLPIDLLDQSLAATPEQVWDELWARNAAGILRWHRELNDHSISTTAWQEKGGRPEITIDFTTPLNRAYPKQSINTEVACLVSRSEDGFVIQTRCISQGVPFSSAFANYVQWVAHETVSGQTRLQITAESRFHGNVWGPIRGQILRESEAGMRKAYAVMATLLLRRFGPGAPLPEWRPTSQPGGSSSEPTAMPWGGAVPALGPSLDYSRWIGAKELLKMVLLSLLVALCFQWLGQMRAHSLYHYW